MRSWTVRALAAGLIAALAPAQAQEPPPAQEPPAAAAPPTSLLPPGRFEPAPPPPAESPAAPVSAAEPPPAVDLPGAIPGAPAAVPQPPQPVQRPSISLTLHGVLAQPPMALGVDAWKGLSGPEAARLMRLQPTPGVSRFHQRLMQRLMLSQAAPPQGMNPASFAAARAFLLVRDGHVEAAKALIAPIPINAYTADLYNAAAQVHMAAGDLPAACPMAMNAAAFSRDPLWPKLNAVCMALQGDDGGAAIALDFAREGRQSDQLDIRLATRLVTAIAGGTAAGAVNWEPGTKVTTLRLALILASGAPLPAGLIDQSPRPVRAWLARTASLPLPQRYDFARVAAGIGAFSADDMLNLWSLRAASMDEFTRANAPEGQLEQAFTARRWPERVAALKELWASARTPLDQVAIALATSRAAAAVPPERALADAPLFARNLIIAGDWRALARWYPALERSGSAIPRDQAWAYLKLADVRRAIPADPERLERWYDSLPDSPAKERQGQLAAAAFRGLWGEDAVDDLPRGVRNFDPANEALAARILKAGAARNRAEVILLIGPALGWDPKTADPGMLEAVVRALALAGLPFEARFISAEIIARNAG